MTVFASSLSPDATPPRELRLAPGLLAELETQSRAAYPEECCGLLIGRTGLDVWTVLRTAPSPNVAPPPRTMRFEIDPALLLRLQRELRGSAETVIGLYHSHPDGTPRPSSADRARAWQSGQMWLVLAVARGAAVSAGAWFRGGGADALFTPLALVAAPS